MKRALTLALLLGGCTVGPDYHPPQDTSPPAYGALPSTPTQSPLSTPLPVAGDISQWWRQLNDAELNMLVARAVTSNPDLLAAASRVRQAREAIVVASAAELPRVDANGLAAHVHSGSSIADKLGSGSAGGGGAAPAGATDIKFYSLGFDATWEIDVFGGVRRSVEAANANGEAAEWALHDGEVMLTAEVAADYFTLRATQARIAILTDEEASQRNTLGLTGARRRAGFVTELDVNQQNALVTETTAQIPLLKAQARVLEHAIAVLLAQQPETLVAELDAKGALPPIPATLPVGLPSDLLRRRPDIREAERKLAAATAEVGAATADLYPKFNLIAAVNFSSNHVSDLLSGNNLGEVGLGSVMWPIFHGGEIHANIRSKEEDMQQAYLAYQKSVLGAVQNVEDALIRYDTDQQSLRARQQSEAAARSSVGIARAQYRAGVVTYVNVLTAQANALSARDQVAQGQQSLVTDMVALFKALGGGWQPDK